MEVGIHSGCGWVQIDIVGEEHVDAVLVCFCCDLTFFAVLCRIIITLSLDLVVRM